MNQKPLVILGSARKHSDTEKVVRQLFREQEMQVLDLLDYKLYPYSYSGEYPADDQFREVVHVLLQHQVLVWATPVYWYAMSSKMKVLFDRLTDLVTIQKPLGRQLKGKQTGMVAVGAEALLPEGYEVPFQLTATYFGMAYVAGIYCIANATEHVHTKEQHAFLEKLRAAALFKTDQK